MHGIKQSVGKTGNELTAVRYVGRQNIRKKGNYAKNNGN